MMNVEGAFAKDEIIAWDAWLNGKQMANEELINAIVKKDAKAVANVLNETTAKHGCVADANVKGVDLSTPLHFTVTSGTVEIAEILLKHFAEVNAQDEEGITPLHLACLSGNLPMVKKLLSWPGVSVELKDSTGSTPAHQAASNLQEDILLLIIEKKPAVAKATNTQGKTVIDLL